MNKEKRGKMQEFMEFGRERVYILVAIARSKDNEGVRATNQPTIRKIVEDEEELGDKLEQLEHATSRFPDKYRLYFTVNARNTVDAMFNLREEMEIWTQKSLKGDEQVKVNTKRIDHEWKSILHQPCCRDDKYFLFDLDNVNVDEFILMRQILSSKTDILISGETPNGYHIVTKPFNYTELDVDSDYELKKDDMLFVDFL